MATIEKLIIHNFKSFKKAECTLGTGVIEITGPNGSGKSNIIDALRFCLGELNMKSLRAKNTKDLINQSAAQASVTLIMNDPKSELKRAINTEGKIAYKLNGKKVRRADVENFLYSIGLDPSFYNIIPQGQVQKIIDLDPKKRRELIDALAGIAEYEDKKKESLKELETVQNRLNEATLILSEREAYLESLKKDKEIAEIYLDAKNKFSSARMSIIKMDIEEYKTELELIIAKQKELFEKKKKNEQDFFAIEKKLRELESEKTKYLSKVKEMTEKEALLTEKSKIESEISVADALIIQIQKKEDETSKQIENLYKEKSHVEEVLETTQAVIHEKTKQIEEAKNNFENKFGKSSAKSNSAQTLLEMQKEEEKLEQAINELMDKKTALMSEQSALKAQLVSMNEEKLNLEAINASEDMDAVEILVKEKNALENGIKKLFEREKEINQILPELDKRILELKDKVADLKITIRASTLNDFVANLKTKIQGIHGFVYELIDFDDEYAEAINASGAGRLNYLVVENLDIAKTIFDVLKRQKIGRITCIPIKDLVIDNFSVELPKESIGFVKDFIRTKDQYRKTLEFVFGNTIMVKTLEIAKKLKGKYRLVTLDGELIEPTGVATGGFSTHERFNYAKFEKIEKDLEDSISQKKEYFNELQNLRQEMNSMRQRRTEIDVKIREYEVMQKIEKENSEKKRLRAKELEVEINNIKERIIKMGSELERIEKSIHEMTQMKKNITAQINAISIESIQITDQDKDKQNAYELISTIKAELATAKERKAMLEKNLKELILQIENTKKQLNDALNERQTNERIKHDKLNKLNEIQAKIDQLDAEISKKSTYYKKIEDEYILLAETRGKLIVEKEKIDNEYNKNEIKKAQVETKYKDLVSEIDYQALEQTKTLDLPKTELQRMMSDAEKILNEYGPTVNMKAPELYAERAKGVLEAKEKIEKLMNEREAIMKFIAEIEEKKKDIFVKTFTKINDNFRKLFSIIFKDAQGYLELDKPNSPFESGLYIKMIRSGKKMALESLSGGEKSMLSLLFILSMHSTKTAPFYVFDEADAALDKENSKKFGQLMRELSKTTQIIVITHNDIVLKYADKIIGVTKGGGSSASELYGIKIEPVAAL